GDTITCCYHGWRFDVSGSCVEIPSLREGQAIDLGKIRCGAYACVERQGLVWIYFPAADKAASAPAEPPRMPVFSDAASPATTLFSTGPPPAALIMLPSPCSPDHPAFGPRDPPRAGFVPTSWWFNPRPTTLPPKEKQFEPIELGWRMVRHPLPPQNLVYKLL